MTAENFFRSFGYIPSGEWIGDNLVETNDPFVVPRVLNRPPCIVCGAQATCEWREYDRPTIWTCAEHYSEDKREGVTIDS